MSGLVLSEKPQTERKLPEACAQPAYLTEVIHLGTHDNLFDDTARKVKKLRIVAELTNETIEVS